VIPRKTGKVTGGPTNSDENRELSLSLSLSSSHIKFARFSKEIDAIKVFKIIFGNRIEL